MSDQKKQKTYVEIPELDLGYKLFSNNPMQSLDAWLNYQRFKAIVAYREEQEKRTRKSDKTYR